MLIITFTLLIAGLATIAVLVTRAQIRDYHMQARKRQQAANLATQLNPAYRTRLEENRRYQLARERQAAELQLAAAEFSLKRYLALTRATPETYILDCEPRSITALPSLRRVTEEKTNPYDRLLKSPVSPPTEDYLLSQIKENSYTVSPGVRASNGEPVLVDVTQVPHGKLIGSSGFGKSTCMYIMLKQAAETNHPGRLQLALLDLEHKTSRLLEDYPHVASFRVGKRLVQMVATDPDMVAEYLGYLKLELDRRTRLSEAELMKLPVLLIYVEEMLSLQYEVVDPKLLQIIFHSLTILSVRGKKYGMFLYACMQTDYSTDELKVSQKMFRFRGAASVDVSAARAAGFINTDLVKHNFQNGKPGQLVIEYPSFSDIVVVPQLELKRLVAQKTGAAENFGAAPDTENPVSIPALKGMRNAVETPPKTDETATEARFQEAHKLWMEGWGKVATIQKIWGVKAGASKAYKQAEAEYEKIVARLEKQEWEQSAVHQTENG